jgi:hypothetical protein
MEGLGTNEDTISRGLGGVDKRVAQEIAAMYQAKYNKNLVEEIRSEVGGDYLKVRGSSCLIATYRAWCMASNIIISVA